MVKERVYKPIKLLVHEDLMINIEDIEKELNTSRNNRPLPFIKNKIELYKYKLWNRMFRTME